jgi:hypothetical protein
MERTVSYNNTLDNERIMFRNGEYSNLRNNINKCTTQLHLLILLHNFEQYFIFDSDRTTCFGLNKTHYQAPIKICRKKLITNISCIKPSNMIIICIF